MPVCVWYYHGMKVAVSIPEELFESAESLGKRLRVSRSRLYATALSEFLAKHQGRKVTDRLNQVYATEDGRLDERLARLQRRSLGPDAW
jgi:metal-responsive CopG/Arc/MetJ family transcriptional regulator